MSSKDDLVGLLEKLVEQDGVRKVKKSLVSLLSDSEKPTLTIIANLGSHRIPDRYLRGEVYVASEGNLDFSSQSKVLNQYKGILGSARNKLMERTWGQIYLIPTGHVTLSLQLKMLVYRVTRMNTVDIFYSDGKFFELEIDQRRNLSLRNDG